ncbi:Gp138 family membrane-puncturing spike protein [Serratia aquatilis]|uniref:Gp138 family membrane-puncturing spike protein n=1 Tax=Serratia aquatilis TaxID=1737515 RepID=A0ABV6EEJ7_9GAMM
MIGLPGQIVAYDDSLQRAVVECGIQRHVGKGEYKTLPKISHVPVQFSGSTDWTVFHELPAGTEGFIHFSQRAVDYWLEQGGPVQPLDARMFNASDAFFAPGYRSMKTVIPGLPTDGIGMSNASGTVRLHLNDEGIELKVGGQRLSLSSDGLRHNGVNIGSDHRHGGVRSGPDKSGTPE